MESIAKMSDNMWLKIFKKNDNIVTRKIGDELFLVPVRGTLADMQKIFTLNRVAEYVWNELNDKTLYDICNAVVSSFDVKKEQAESDIREFITELLEADLITG